MLQPSIETGHSSTESDTSKETITICNKYETIASGLEYKGSGIKTSLHGTIYQIKLLMLFLNRGLKRGYHFSLGTEVDDAEKFDDLVFSYDNVNNDGQVYRFLQAKHKQDESKTIKCDDLLKETDDDFSILKYFISYRKIKQNKMFKGVLEEFIICTNINLDDEVLKSDDCSQANPVYEIDQTTDSILAHKNHLKSKQYKFTKYSEFYRKLKLILKNTHSDKLATILAKMVLKKEKTLLKDELLKCYRGWLLEKVFKIERDNNGRFLQFGDDFLQNPYEGDEISNFKRTFITSFQKAYPNDEVASILQKSKFKIPETFAVETKDSLSLDVTDVEIDDFLDKIVLAVNQPNEVELQSIISEEISRDMNFINGEFIANRLLGYVLDWAKERKGRFLTYSDGIELFKHLKQNLARIGLVGLNLAYKSKVSKDYTFKDDVQVITIVKNFLRYKKQQILAVYYKSPLLSSMKILQANTEEEVDASIFCDLKIFQCLIGTESCPIDAFQSEAHYHLIIDNIAKVFEVKEILKKIGRTLKQNKNKRIILNIAYEEREISENIIHNLLKDLDYDEKNCVSVVDEDNNFCNLCPESQKKLLDESKVIFQGEEVNLCSVLDEHTDLISGVMLSKLISHDRIEIGEAPVEESYKNFKEYFIGRRNKLHRECIRIEHDVRDKRDRIQQEGSRIERDVKDFLKREEVRAAYCPWSLSRSLEGTTGIILPLVPEFCISLLI